MNNKEKIYEEIINHFNEFHYAPSVRDLLSKTGIHSTATIHKYLKELEKEGLIYKSKKISRSIRLVEKNE